MEKKAKVNMEVTEENMGIIIQQGNIDLNLNQICITMAKMKSR